MPRFAANLSMLFTELPFLDRFEAAARAGFDAVECQFPYAWDASEIERRLDDHDLALVLYNLPAGTWERGERGIACVPGREADFRGAVVWALEYARRLGVDQLNCLAGIVPPGVSPREARQVFVANLTYAAGALEAAGVKLLVEAINTRDVPGFLLDGSDRAMSIIDEVGSDNLYFQYDVYHMQRMEGELAATLERHLPRIAHVQVADTPGRHEPGSGEINFPFLFAWLDRIGYRGWVGCEYLPATTTTAGLGWLDRVRGPRRTEAGRSAQKP